MEKIKSKLDQRLEITATLKFFKISDLWIDRNFFGWYEDIDRLEFLKQILLDKLSCSTLYLTPPIIVLIDELIDDISTIEDDPDDNYSDIIDLAQFIISYNSTWASLIELKKIFLVEIHRIFQENYIYGDDKCIELLNIFIDNIVDNVLESEVFGKIVDQHIYNICKYIESHREEEIEYINIKDSLIALNMSEEYVDIIINEFNRENIIYEIKSCLFNQMYPIFSYAAEHANETDIYRDNCSLVNYIAMKLISHDSESEQFLSDLSRSVLSTPENLVSIDRVRLSLISTINELYSYRKNIFKSIFNPTIKKDFEKFFEKWIDLLKKYENESKISYHIKNLINYLEKCEE